MAIALTVLTLFPLCKEFPRAGVKALLILESLRTAVTRPERRSRPEGFGSYDACVNASERHLRLLTETTAAVNSTLDLEEVLHLVAEKVADALQADACFVYLYDSRADELVLRATHGTSVDELGRRPRMRPGEGITGSAAAERAPVMIPAAAHLDPRFKQFPN